MKNSVRTLALLGVLGLGLAAPAMAQQEGATTNRPVRPMMQGEQTKSREAMQQMRAARFESIQKQNAAIRALIEDNAKIKAAGKIDKALQDKLVADLTALEAAHTAMMAARPNHGAAPQGAAAPTEE